MAEGKAKRILVMGAGRVGRVIALDLASSFEVTAADRSGERLAEAFSETPVRTLEQDLLQPGTMKEVAGSFDLVVGALPGSLGRQSIQNIIDAGVDLVDISFFPEDPAPLREQAAGKGVRVIVDMGVAPGMSNALLGHHVARWQRVDRFECLVGGLPVERRWPFEYRAPFSPADVIEEYTRPARIREAGQILELPALSRGERVDFAGIGTLEAFLTDGLRSLLQSYSIPDMWEKTLRYPGHRQLMEIFRETGLFDSKRVQVADVEISPLELVSNLLFKKWQLGPEEAEFTIMEVRIEGESRPGVEERAVWQMLDRTDFQRGFTSMARTTGFACTAAVHLLAGEALDEPGFYFPEALGEDEDSFQFLLDYQAERGVHYRRTSKPQTA